MPERTEIKNKKSCLMLKNFFKTALRNLMGNKTFSFINIVGLAIGISASLVIFLIVQYDFNFDKFENAGNRIYRVVSDYAFSGKAFHSSGVPHGMPLAVKNEVTGLEAVAPFRTWNEGAKVSVPAEKENDIVIYKKQKDIAFVDENYFKLIPYNWIAGSPKTSLQQPYQIVLTETNAKLYFPKLDAEQIVGKEIVFNDTVRTTVTGIVKNIKQNTDFSFKTFISRATIELPRLKPDDGDDWGSTNNASQLFIKLSEGTTATQIENQITALFKKNYTQTEQTRNITITHSLQPLSNVHFNADYDNFDQRLAHKPTLYGLLAVAAFLLLLASVNFINLTTAQASKRAKEIGIRKIVGSSKKQLVFQFLSETFLLTAIASILSLGLTPLLLRVFSDFIPDGLRFNLLHQPDVFLFLLLLLLTLSLLSGLYPALILSSYKPVLVLKNQIYTARGNPRSAWLRKSLTVSQFVIAQVFIIATILVGRQISYTLNKDLGFKKEAVIYFDTNYYNDNDPNHKFILHDKLKAIPEIAMVSLSSEPPSSIHFGTRIIKYKDGKKEIETDADKNFADTNYIKLYQMKLLAGTNLPYSDTIHNLIINETYAHVLGFKDPQQAIGKYLEWDKNMQCPIVGVVADFHQKSLHEAIKPFVISGKISDELTFNIALQPQNAERTIWKTAIMKIEKAFKEVYPNDDFEYSFLDESIAKYYTAEQNISRLLMWATALAIFISCLGLSGLVIYVTNQRTKEIGIRKVVGATVTQIVSLLSKDFLQLIVIAFIIAIPIAWFGANKWLENFAYKTSLSWWIFIAGGLIIFILALIILCLRTFKAATANPVKSLRTE
jgi:putative ABC transport system permease protein